MDSIIKHFEFKSSEGMAVSIDAARFKGKPVFLAVPLAKALGYTNPADALKKHCKSLIKLNYSESRELGFGDNPRGIQLVGQADLFSPYYAQLPPISRTCSGLGLRRSSPCVNGYRNLQYQKGKNIIWPP